MGNCRHSGNRQIENAKRRTLKMTILIVAVFVMCWTPYFVISVWWWIDKDSAQRINHKLQRGLFIFAVSNSCMNPFVYGVFVVKIANELKRCCCCLRQPTSKYFCQTVHIKRKPQEHIVGYNQKLVVQQIQHQEKQPINHAQQLHSLQTINLSTKQQTSTIREGIARICLNTMMKTPSSAISNKDSAPVTPPHISNGKGIDFKEESIVVFTP